MRVLMEAVKVFVKCHETQAVTVLIGTVRVSVKAVTLKGHESGTRGLETVVEAARRECLRMH